ncbi:MAG TPA: tRNA (adenosine(37)-N6)-threonylcarbamoyltransferase complex dimerization subunit type 1 TsaB [Actinobacteria bacterium]|nr:tRNA (adenosine(37)-N6)-threonylcarbamoyltransferase complex dimerization subunit type 1 TsaB [Actinomycetes bacterium]HEX21693.1 tRNA (adenosine(37)-N6)-threonylcarbamoyltransferase complex dimerization subunit type 1 TsaB [Actinomycetota bacterium]
MDKPTIIAFDTTSDYISLALGNSNEIIANQHIYGPRAHLAHLMPAIDGLLKRAGLCLPGLDAIAVGTGPGSFTGTRIGIATAKSLAQGSGKPLIGISSLDILAAGLETDPRQLSYPIIDANRHEIYTAAYHGNTRFSAYQILTVDELSEIMARESAGILATGNGLVLYEEYFLDKLGDKFITAAKSKWFPNAKYLIELAEKSLRQERPPGNDYYTINPIYLRLSDAEERLKRQKRP